MPNIDELLRKNKQRLEKISEPTVRKKIVRTGPTRPWQEHLPEYNTQDISTQDLGEIESQRLSNTTSSRIDLNSNSEEIKVSVPEPLPEATVTTNQQETYNEPTSNPQVQTQTEQNKQRTNKILTRNTILFENGQFLGIGEETNKKQTKNQQDTHNTPTRYPQFISNPQNNLQRTNKVPATVPTREQTINLQETCKTPTRNRFNLLSGLRRSVVLFIYENCKVARSEISDPFTFESVGLFCQTTPRSAGETIKLLAKENYLIPIDRKKGGRAAWHIYKIVDDIYQDILLLEAAGKLTRNPQLTNKEPYGEQTSQPTNVISSSSSVLNTSITTTEEPKVNKPSELPEEWKDIDFSCLESVRFTEHHLLQIYQCKKVSAEVAQESIYELHHDLTVNQNKSLRNPRNVLLSLLKKGTPYTSPGYEPEYLKAERRCLEEQKRRQGELARIRDEHEQLKNAPSLVAKDSQFQSWMAGLSVAEKKRYAPVATVDGGDMQKGLLRSYWENHIAEQEIPEEESREWIRKQINQSLGNNPSEA